MTRRTAALGLWLATFSLSAFAEDSPRPPLPPAEAMEKTFVEPELSGTLTEAFGGFGKLVGVRLNVDWPAMADAGLKASDRVAVKAARATGGQLLDLVLIRAAKKGKPLAWYVHEDSVRVTTQARVLYRRWLPRALIAPEPASRPALPAPAATQEIVFDQTPLEDVIDFLRTSGQVNIYVNWRSMEAIGVTRQTPVNLRASGLALGRLLTLVTDQVSAAGDKLNRVWWVIDEGVVHVASGEALNTTLRTRVIEVSDLLLVAPNFKATRFATGRREAGDQTDGGSAGGLFETDSDSRNVADEDTAARRQQIREDIVAIIKDAIGEEMWQPIGKGSVRLLGDKLIISQTPLGYKLLEEAGR